METEDEELLYLIKAIGGGEVESVNCPYCNNTIDLRGVLEINKKLKTMNIPEKQFDEFVEELKDKLPKAGKVIVMDFGEEIDTLTQELKQKIKENGKST